MYNILCKCCERPLILDRKMNYETCKRCGYNYVRNKKLDIVQRKLWWVAKVPWYVIIPMGFLIGYLLPKLLIITHILHVVKK